MSYEGRVQLMCLVGHVFTLDYMWQFNEGEVSDTCPCPVCGAPNVSDFSVAIDDTNFLDVGLIPPEAWEPYKTSGEWPNATYVRPPDALLMRMRTRIDEKSGERVSYIIDEP